MSGIRTGIFQNEQEYYQALTGWARELLASYALTHVKASENGMLRKNGGVLITRAELLQELKPEPPASAGEETTTRSFCAQRLRISGSGAGRP